MAFSSSSSVSNVLSRSFGCNQCHGEGGGELVDIFRVQLCVSGGNAVQVPCYNPAVVILFIYSHRSSFHAVQLHLVCIVANFHLVCGGRRGIEVSLRGSVTCVRKNDVITVVVENNWGVVIKRIVTRSSGLWGFVPL